MVLLNGAAVLAAMDVGAQRSSSGARRGLIAQRPQQRRVSLLVHTREVDKRSPFYRTRDSQFGMASLPEKELDRD